MARVCTVCTHDQRQAIDRALVSRTPYRNVTQQFGVSKFALSRHLKEHLPELLAKAHEAERAVEADKLLWDLRRLQIHTLRALTTAEAAADWQTMLKAVKEARSNLALMGEMRGQLDRRPQIHLHLTPEWIELRTVIVRALEAYPTARESVVAAITAAGDGRARAGNGHA